MDSIGIDHAHIAGFSLGGTIAMRMAIDHPARVRGLVLVATSSRVGRAAADWYQQRVDMVNRNDPELRATLDRDAADVYAESVSELRTGSSSGANRPPTRVDMAMPARPWPR